MGIIRAIVFILCLALAGPVLAQDYVPGEIIVKMKSSSSQARLQRFASKMSFNRKMSLKRSWSRFNMHQFKIEASQNMEDLLNETNLDPDVEYAEPNYIFRKQTVGVEGEPMSFSEVTEELEGYNTSSSGGFSQTSADISADEAWNILSSTPARPIVAVIDSGVDYNHYVFVDSGAIWNNSDEIPNNGLDDDGNGYVDDVRGWNFVNNSNDPMDDDNHGTHVAGIVLGMTQNILSASLQPAVIQIMPLKFLDNQGAGTTADAIEAINYAVNNGAQILNNSWGGGNYSTALRDAVVTVNAMGLSFIAAAGNSANNNDAAPTYPASYSVPNVVSIAATSSSDNLASFSNFGASSVHVASPGISVLSTLPNDSFGYSSGTSMAAPFAAGLAALMVRENPGTNGQQVKGVLFDHSDGVGSLFGKVASESRIDAFDALNFVQNTDMASYQPAFSGAGRDPAASGAAAGGCGMIAKVLGDRGGKGKGPGSGGGLGQGLMLLLLFAPLLLINILKIRGKSGEDLRQFPRYKLSSEVRIAVGEKELVGQVSTISLGGARIDTDALLEQGGVVTLNIASPDGKQQIEVQGRVVWCEQKKAYGVQFCDAKDEAMAAIGGWTKSLTKA